MAHVKIDGTIHCESIWDLAPDGATACGALSHRPLEACRQPGVIKVVAAWGNHGAMYGRAQQVLGMLKAADMQLHCLKVSQDGTGEPMHPLARGKNFLPLETELEVYG